MSDTGAGEPQTPDLNTTEQADTAGTTDAQPVRPEDDRGEALVAALIEVERHVGRFGWDQPARLFALVPTAELLAAEPSLAAHLGPGAEQTPEGAYSSIEQEDFRAGDDLVTTLSKMVWPETVHGCVLTLERTFLPPRYESSIPDDPIEAERFVNGHEHRQDMRVVVGALRGGESHGVARVQSEPNELLGGPQLAPGIARALVATLAP